LAAYYAATKPKEIFIENTKKKRNPLYKNHPIIKPLKKE
jgi:hypothetical protein